MHFVKVEEFQGLKFDTDVRSESKIAVVVGRNGSGKSRLLQGIVSDRIKVALNDEVVNRNSIRLISLNELRPNFGEGYNEFQERQNRSQAVAMYQAFKGNFQLDVERSVEALHSAPSSGVYREYQFDRRQLALIVSKASQDLGKDPNDLSNDDVSDYAIGYGFANLGTINVMGIMRTYWDRVEENKFNAYKNNEYAAEETVWNEEQFILRFGPPPWEVLNEFLNDILGGRYYFEVPTRGNIHTYEGRLYRAKDNLVVQPHWLSSGEKVLMWLCLSMYAANSPRSPEPPRLLLLDEPDSALHPEMVQQLHRVLNSIADRFSTGILFTSHSPTTISLFNAGPVWKISEDSLVEVDKDTAIGELLVGLDQVVVHYSKCRQVYVESHKDEEIYSELFSFLRFRRLGVSDHLALAFVPAAPKLAEQNIRDQVKAHLGNFDDQCIESFVRAINGQGDCAKVLGAVESLNVENAVPVCGVIDWDGENKPKEHIYVLGESLFDNIESAVLNPLTLGLYLLQNYSGHLNLVEYGLDAGCDFHAVVSDVAHWQGVADGVMRRVLCEDEIRSEVRCDFVAGGSVYLDKRYTYMDGHTLEGRIRGNSAYPFLNEIRRPTLMMDVITRGIKATGGRSLPSAFLELFKAIQVTG